MSSDDKAKADGWSVITEFLTSIYGQGKENQVWLAGFPDIEAGPSWFGMQGVDALRRRLPDPDGADLYFCTGLLRDGANNRTLGEVVAQPLLYADDIGTKVDPAMWDALFAMGFPEPTFRIETSPNNETWGWKLEGDAGSPERWQELALVRAYMIERKLTDALHDATRYLRLPWGHNSKPKYRDSKNRAPAVGFTDWHPERVVSLDDIGRVLIGGADWRQADVPMSAKTSKDLAALGAGARPRDASLTDPVVRMAEIVGLEPRERSQGVVDALCPNWQAHGDRAETGFSFIGSDGACFCNHASCDNLRTPDFLAMVRTQYENHVSALNAAGKNTESLPPSASAFEAGVGFRADDETERRVVQAEADALASRNLRRREQAAEQHEDGMDRLARRFVWVQEAENFFDTKLRCLVSDKQLSRMKDVRAYIPVTETGKKAAPVVLLSHARMDEAMSLTYKPGIGDALVSCNTEQGKPAPHINTWVGSEIIPRKERPQVWLELVEHLMPDADYREWFLNWNAYRLQNPGKRTPVFPLIVGGQGTGKDLTLAPLVTIEGVQNVQFVNMARLESNFNDWMRASLVILPELKLSADGKLYNNLKDWTGQNAGRVQINGKYARTYSIEPAANFIGFTNHLNAVQGMEPDDRRISTYVSPAVPKDKLWYMQAAPVLHSLAEAERVYDFLMSRSLANFNPHDVPDAAMDSKRRMLIDTLPDGGSWVYDLCAEGGKLAGRKFLTIAEIEAMAQTDAPQNIRSKISSGVVRRGLEAAQCEALGQIKAGRQRASIWYGPGMSASERTAANTRAKADLLREAEKERQDFAAAQIASAFAQAA